MTVQAVRKRTLGPAGGVATLADAESDVLPIVPAPWVHDAFERISAREMELLLRFKIVPVTWMPTRTITAVVDSIGKREAQRRGMPVVGRIEAADFRSAFHRRFAKNLLNQTTHRLRRSMPKFSAASRLEPRQAFAFCFLLITTAGLTALFGSKLMFHICALLAGLFFFTIVTLRVMSLLPVSTSDTPGDTADANAHDRQLELPVYTILAPVFRELRVVDQLVRALSALRYPENRLDIKLILEETDIDMQRHVNSLSLPEHFDIIVVPAGFPQTKPRALNYALQFARGSLVTIFDSEDVPERDQLLKAAQRFSKADRNLACLQARLRFYNPMENWLTRQFSAEYAMLFEGVLPMLADMGLPMPLGGTSNHFRVEALERIGGWDPFNVTEDADLGLRLARLGYTADMLDSVTFEEANVSVRNWLRQRRRWLKGFLQTWLVHSRNPVEAAREFGMVGYVAAQCMTFGVFASALLHPLLVISGIWWLCHPNLDADGTGLACALLAGLNLFLLLAGYVTTAIAMQQNMARAGLPGWWQLALTLPIYWILICVAAWQAMFDFVVAPFHWHKTEHGLSRLTQPRNTPRPQRHVARKRVTCNP